VVVLGVGGWRGGGKRCMEWCVDRTKTRIAGENTLRRMRTRAVAWGGASVYALK